MSISVVITKPFGFFTDQVIIYATPPLSAGISAPKESLYRLITRAGLSIATSQTVNFTTLYLRKYGKLQQGQKVFVKVRFITNRGRAGPLLYRVTVIS